MVANLLHMCCSRLSASLKGSKRFAIRAVQLALKMVKGAHKPGRATSHQKLEKGKGAEFPLNLWKWILVLAQ